MAMNTIVAACEIWTDFFVGIIRKRRELCAIEMLRMTDIASNFPMSLEKSINSQMRKVVKIKLTTELASPEKAKGRNIFLSYKAELQSPVRLKTPTINVVNNTFSCRDPKLLRRNITIAMRALALSEIINKSKSTRRMLNCCAWEGWGGIFRLVESIVWKYMTLLSYQILFIICYAV